MKIVVKLTYLQSATFVRSQLQLNTGHLERQSSMLTNELFIYLFIYYYTIWQHNIYSQYNTIDKVQYKNHSTKRLPFHGHCEYVPHQSFD